MPDISYEISHLRSITKHTLSDNEMSDASKIGSLVWITSELDKLLNKVITSEALSHQRSVDGETIIFLPNSMIAEKGWELYEAMQKENSKLKFELSEIRKDADNKSNGKICGKDAKNAS